MTQAEQIRKIREWANVRAVAATPREHRAEYDETEQLKVQQEQTEQLGGPAGS